MKAKHVILSAIIFILITGLSCTVSLGSDKRKKDLNTKIASVNGVAITKKDFIWAVSSQDQRLTSSGKVMDRDEMAQLRKDSFSGLINRELLYQQSQKKGIQVSELRIEQEFSKVRMSMMSDVDLDTIEKELDLTEKDIKFEFRRVFAIQKLIDQELGIDDTVTETEVKNYYESNIDKFIVPGPVKTSHILIEADENSDASEKAQARKQIEMIQKKLKNGEDFAELAKKYSQSPSSIKGGDIGYVKKGQFVKSFEKAVFALEPGEVSDLVDTSFGYHLIKVTERKPEHLFAYEDVKDKLEKYLKSKKVNDIISKYISKLKENAKIEKFYDPVDIQY